ncbi:MFS transporter [Rhodococcus sp. MALMAid1271]|uniref:MFS transporter n=1 Tax=Rhodococcus sp. MALMAid1271 TaxID=3411744 RepID=UPI003BA053E2
MGMGAAAFGGWGLLLPVIPLAVSESGASDAVAAASTAIFMATTVITQLFVPRMLQRAGHRAVLAAGCLLLGVPALLFIVSVEAVPALAVSAVRGTGFGMLTVAGAAIVAELAPIAQLGRATGAQGIAVALAQVLTLPLGLVIFAVSPTAVFVLGAVVPAAGLVGVALLPPTRPAARPPTAERVRLEVRCFLVPCLAVATVSAAYGGITSLLPIAKSDRAAMIGLSLAVVSAAMLVGRYVAGSVADRVGIGRSVVPALVSAAVGVAVFAIAALGAMPAALFFVAAVVFGIGYGACQNDSLVMAFDAAGPARYSNASAVWNISFDAGTGAGALALGVLATSVGYTAGFTAAAAAVVAVAVVALIARRTPDRLSP